MWSIRNPEKSASLTSDTISWYDTDRRQRTRLDNNRIFVSKGGKKCIYKYTCCLFGYILKI